MLGSSCSHTEMPQASELPLRLCGSSNSPTVKLDQISTAFSKQGWGLAPTQREDCPAFLTPPHAHSLFPQPQTGHRRQLSTPPRPTTPGLLPVKHTHPWGLLIEAGDGRAGTLWKGRATTNGRAPVWTPKVSRLLL